MIEIKFLGGAGEVGKSAVLIDNGVEKFIFDYGVNVQTGASPIETKLNLDGVFITHAHLDHSGFSPNLYKRGYTGSVYMTPPTFDLASILLHDSAKLQKRLNREPHFLVSHIKKMEQMIELFNPKEIIEFENSTIKFHDAGHIPGSVTILLETKGKKILYTGDIQFIDTKLMKAAFDDYKDIDVLISESTYSYKNHPDRKELENRLREIIQYTFYNNGITILPAFAVGRTQELLVILHDLGFPIYLDGMGIDATMKILDHPNCIRDAKKLRESFSHVRKIQKSFERPRVMENPCVIITTAGMLNGGPVDYYIRNLYNREDCSLVLTGYQVEGTKGRTLLDTGKYVNSDIDVRLKMNVEFLDFSAHTDHDHLIKFYEKISPGKILVMHGDRTEEFAEELRLRGFDAQAPKNGDKIDV